MQNKHYKCPKCAHEFTPEKPPRKKWRKVKPPAEVRMINGTPLAINPDGPAGIWKWEYPIRDMEIGAVLMVRGVDVSNMQTMCNSRYRTHMSQRWAMETQENGDLRIERKS